ncbi:MAG: glycerate kinase [Clostridia bacterium]|nr:glycerate kinase [Clostridia bacterium]
MKVVIAIDSFKGCLSSHEAGQAVKEGFLETDSSINALVYPVADGGEGTVEALASLNGSTLVSAKARDPLGREIECKYAVLADKTAVIEMSAAAGLPLLKKEERNPLYTSTYGVGQLILDAISRGCRELIIGIGGSSTNDGGVGMLSALGVKLYDSRGEEIPWGAIGLKDLSTIDVSGLCPQIKECKISVACDVKNPLCGKNGASRIYGPQKGADEKTVLLLDRWLENYGRLTKELSPKADVNKEGAGAAGGLGFAFLAYLNGELRPGAQLILDKVGLEADIRDCDLVVTGEGRLDGQSINGKTPVGVSIIAKKYNKYVIALAGSLGDDLRGLEPYIDRCYGINGQAFDLEEALKPENARANLKNTIKKALSELRKEA